MPLVSLVTSVEVTEPDKRSQLLAQLSAKTAELLGKPEAYVMVSLETGATMLMGGEPGPTAFLDVRALGEMTGGTTAALAEALTTVVHDALDVDPGRIFLNFNGLARDMWGHNGRTFA